MQISKPSVVIAVCSTLVAADIPVLAFEQNLPDSPAAAFEDAPSDSAEQVFHHFVPPAANKLDSIQKTPEADLKAYRDGSDAYDKGDVETALKNWESLAKRGDVFAQWRLGNMYRLGLGVKVDHARAFQFYKMAAAQHDDVGRYTTKTRLTVDSLVQIARYYETGLKEAGVAQNVAYAQRLFHWAATHFGHPGAQLQLGLMYLEGIGVTKNVSRGLRWINLAAQKDYAPAQAQLGEVYWGGSGVRKDRPRGLMWYIRAQEAADPGREGGIIERFHELLAAASDKERERAQSLIRGRKGGANDR